MRKLRSLIALASVLAAFAVVGVAWGQQAARTILTLPSMDCDGCAKNIGGEVAKVKGIARIEYDVQGRKMTVFALPNAVLSPRAIWEAVERSDHLPTKLEGPTGTFTKKPPS